MRRFTAPQSAGFSYAIPIFLVDVRDRSQSGLYALVGAQAGFIGGVLGGIAVLILEFILRRASFSESLLLVLTTGIKFGVLAAVLAACLFLCTRWYHRRPLPRLITFALTASNFFAGAFAASLLQILVNAFSDSLNPGNTIVLIGAMTFLGALVGATLSQDAPNLKQARGLVAGLVTGLTTGLLSTAVDLLGLPAPIAFLAGSLLLGAGIGVVGSLVETRFRQALIEIERERGQSTVLGLGHKTVKIGGGRDDEIYIAGAPAHISGLAIREEQIEHVETANGKRTLLQDGSRLRIGTLIMTVHASHQRGRPMQQRRKGEQ